VIRDAVILAAGKGTRLRRSDDDLPKPLHRVGGVPLIKRTILSLAEGGVQRVIVVTGFMAEQIERAVTDDSDFAVPGVRVELVFNPEFEKANGVSVMVVRDDDDMMFTCGMHQFQLPDAQVAFADARQTLAWLDAFCEYQLDEQPVLLSGHTFRPDAEAPQRVLERWPDHRHDPSDGRHNPFGVWRLQEPADARIAAVKLVPTIMPSLVALLLATERSEGRPLTEHEVEKLVSNSTCSNLPR
jgi:hypothetical protein